LEPFGIEPFGIIDGAIVNAINGATVPQLMTQPITALIPKLISEA
jgi:hypothetical protein